MVYTRRWKFIGLTQKCMECVNSVLVDMNLWNDLSFNLYAVPSVYHVVATLDERMKSKMKVSAN